jgi:hypothetical protein
MTDANPRTNKALVFRILSTSSIGGTDISPVGPVSRFKDNQSEESAKVDIA